MTCRDLSPSTHNQWHKVAKVHQPANVIRRSFVSSDVKFHKIFCPEIFHEIFHEIFLKYFKNFTMFFPALCIVHCIKVSKPVKGKYLLLCMNSIMYLLLT